MRSAALCRSLNNSVWFRFDCNVQHYFVLIRNTFIDIFVALTELQKKNYYTHCTTKKHAKFYFRMKKPHKIFFAQKQQRKIFICMWPEHSTIASSWMLKCNASAVVVVAEKMWISQNMWLPSSSSQMLNTNGSFEICQERMFVKQRRKHAWSSYLLPKKIFMLKQKSSNLYMIGFKWVTKFLSDCLSTLH